jgi:outer membrane protein
MFNRRPIRMLGAALVLSLSATAAGAETLADALVQAYRSSPVLEQQRFLLRATDEDVAVAVAALRPSVSFQAEYGKTVTFRDNAALAPATTLPGISAPADRATDTNSSLGFVLQYTLLDGGQRSLRVAAAKESVLSARFSLIQVEQQVLLNAVSAYLNLREAVLTVDVRESNERLLAEQLRAAQDRFEVGEVTRTDVAIAEARLAAARSQLAGARGQVDIQREIYRESIGVLPTGQLAPPPPSPELPPSLDRAQALALQIHPLISAGQFEIVALRLLADAAEADRLPTISLDSGLSYGRPDTTRAQIGLTGNVPIYRGGRLSALNRQAIARAQAARADLNNTAREITLGVGRAWAQLQIAEAQIVASREGVRSASLAYDGFQEEALLGARTTLDVLDAEQELLDARLTLLQSETDAQAAYYDVLAAIGLLTTDHLGLSVERYDPSIYYTLVSDAPAISPSEQGGRLDRVLRRFGRD